MAKKSEGNYSSYALNEEIYFSLADTLVHFSLDRALFTCRSVLSDLFWGTNFGFVQKAERPIELENSKKNLYIDLPN